MRVSESLHVHRAGLEGYKETDVSGRFWERKLRNCSQEQKTDFRVTVPWGQGGKEKESVTKKSHN